MIPKAVVLMLVAMPYGFVVAGDQVPNERVVAEFKALLNGMCAARQQVRSGRVMIEGMKITTDLGMRSISGRVTGEWLFDTSKSRYRFEGMEPHNVAVAPAGQFDLTTDGATRVPVRSRFCRTREYFVNWSQTTPEPRPLNIKPASIFLKPVEAAPREMNQSMWVHIFDPLAAGAMNYVDFSKGRMVADVYGALLAKSVESMEIDGATVTVELKDKDAAHTLVIDADRLIPLSLQSHSAIENESWSFSDKAEWEPVNGVLVPATMTTQLVVHRRAAKDIYKYRLSWFRVNDKFEPGEFEYTEFSNIPDGTEVYDTRSEKIRLLGTYAGGKLTNNDAQ